MGFDLEEVWRIREEDAFPALFGQRFRGIFPLQMEMFAQQFGQSEIDPRWLHYGVFEFAPTNSRGSWLYVTSGHSTRGSNRPEITIRTASPEWVSSSPWP